MIVITENVFNVNFIVAAVIIGDSLHSITFAFTFWQHDICVTVLLTQMSTIDLFLFYRTYT